jgi:hypothetical protein
LRTTNFAKRYPTPLPTLTLTP